MVFVDTSGFYAFLSPEDQDHGPVVEAFRKLRAAGETLGATSYVLAETLGLVQRRLGLQIVRRFAESVLPAVDLRWVGPAEHRAAWALLEQVGKRSFTIVDASTAAVMREEGQRRVLALDAEFARLGFEVLPEAR